MQKLKRPSLDARDLKHFDGVKRAVKVERKLETRVDDEFEEFLDTGD